MAYIVLLCVLAAVGLVCSKHGHLCGKSNHNGSVGELHPHDGKIPAGHECMWHIYPESFNIPEVFMVIENFELDEKDRFTVSKHDSDLLFGPFSGSKETFTILTGFLMLDVTLEINDSPSKDRLFKSYFTTNDCYYLLEEEEGSMTSPLYQDVKLRKNITCTWRFKKFKQVTLPRTVVFKNFHLMSSTLTVKGSKAQDGIYSGTKLPENVIAFGETQFILNLNTTVPGETFSFHYSLNTLNIPPTEHDSLLVTSDNGELKSTTARALLHSSHLCGHITLQGAQGWFHPKNETMTAQQRCLWTIGPVPQPSGIYVVIEKYDLLDDDMFMIRSPSEGPALFGPYSGKTGPFSIFTDETTVEAVLEISSSDLLRKRHFKAFYSTAGCHYPVNGDFGVIHSPFYKMDDQKKTACTWTFVRHDTESVVSISFNSYNIKSSFLQVDGSINQDQIYKATDGPFDILMKANGNLTVEIDRTTESETISFSYNTVDTECTDYIKIMKKDTTTLSFPPSDSKDKNSMNCLWIVEGSEKGVLAVYFEDVNLKDTTDMILIKEGRTRNSPNLVQVTEVNQAHFKGSYVVAGTNTIWVSYTTNYAFKGSHFKIRVNISEDRNYLSKGQDFIIDSPGPGVDVIFHLEVENDEQVILNMQPGQELPSSGEILVYDGFNVNTVLTKIHAGKIYYPVVATGSKMMLVAKGFAKGNSVKLRFDGIKKGCHHVTFDQRGTYALSGHCGSTCSWVILPKSDNSEEMLSLHLTSVALRPHDIIEVRRLDNDLTLIETIKSNENSQPSLFLPASDGAYIKITRASCLSPDAVSVAFVASVETLRGCSMNLQMKTGEKISLTSPNYPDVYPLNSNCFWNISTKANSLYVSFKSFQLANGHCVKVHEIDNSGHVIDSVTYGSSVAPDDKMLSNNIAVQLIASPCVSVNSSLLSSSGNGFLLDVFAFDCGGKLGREMKGTLSTPDFPKPVTGSLLCIWLVEVPPRNEGGSVNVLAFNITWSAKSSDEQTGLTIYDGPTLSSEILVNDTTTINQMSKRNSVIFIYQQNDTSEHTAVRVDFESRTGNMLCDSGIYMHPDWICNDVNNCGDYSDEKNCKARAPPPPPVRPLPPNVEVTKKGVSPPIFWSLLPTAFILGIVGTIAMAYFLKEVKKRREQDYDTMPILS